MPRKARIRSRTGIYHVMFRGANRQEIFHDDQDCMKFLETILNYKLKLKMQVYAWCLMNNHVHLLLKEGDEEISITMKRIGVSYVNYYNLKYRTTGHLFQDRFRSENIETIKSLLTVTRYIHQNPFKAGLVTQIGEWKWSSCGGYFGKKIYPEGLLDSNYILGMYSEDTVFSLKKFKEFNEAKNDDVCLENTIRVRYSDEEARPLIRDILGPIEIAQVKSLPKSERNEVLKEVKQLKGLTQRQIARILGISVNLVFKA